jgi:PKD repeat protein
VVYPKPGTKINWNPESPTITEEVTFNPTFSYEPTSYTWFFSGLVSGTSSDTLNIKNPQLLYNNTGQYPVILICKTENECTDTVIKI